MSYDPVLHLRTSPGDRWQFRWKFEFMGSKPSKTGGWFPASKFEDMASAVNKDGLLWAVVEGKHWTTRELREFLRVPGPDFINFEHLAVQIMNDKGSINHVYGLRVQTRAAVVSCIEDGNIKYERRELSANHLFPEWTKY